MTETEENISKAQLAGRVSFVKNQREDRSRAEMTCAFLEYFRGELLRCDSAHNPHPSLALDPLLFNYERRLS